ncbi:hypothetical protein U1737_07115 [Sphingomonas sp. LB3N6]|uniref:hypothetical protein n=1 Tax=Sphingomonas fucosidasi TaxID=3096164 RepID=UPI002FC9849F
MPGTDAGYKTAARPLSIGSLFSDRVEAFLDGRVGIPGFDAHISIVEAQTLFRTVLRDGTYDVAELSMSSHIAAVAAGRRDYVGLPVFPSRSFRHSNLYVRSDRGITRAADLAGRTIGLIDFQQTAALWIRGILADDHGVPRESVRWVAAGLHAPVLDDRAPVTVGHGIRLERSASTLDQLLRDGLVDAVISPTAPRCHADPDVPVTRLWPDFKSEELAWWHQTGIFPIMHVLVVKRALLDAHPGLSNLLFRAFDEARRLAANDIVTRDFPKIMLPWITTHAAHVRAVFDHDPWTYGIEPNRAAISTMLRYAVADGSVRDGLRIEQLFE